jgi:hypothetical protein
MEKRQLFPALIERDDSDALENTAMLRRRQAIQSFLRDPAAAMRQYPELGSDLISFFSQSINPHRSDDTGLPVKGREADYEKWKAAQEWAREFEQS